MVFISVSADSMLILGVSLFAFVRAVCYVSAIFIVLSILKCQIGTSKLRVNSKSEYQILCTLIVRFYSIHTFLHQILINFNLSVTYINKFFQKCKEHNYFHQ